MVGIGTLINVAAVLLGTGVGVALGGRLPDRIRSAVMAMLGMFTIVMGIADALDTFGDVLEGALGRVAVLVVLGSLIIGGIVGELIDIEGRLASLGEWLRTRVARTERVAVPGRGPGAAASTPEVSAAHGTNRFVEGFVLASMVFCVGPLTILGSLSDGLDGNYQLLAVKSLLDGFAGMAFASVFGIGVGFSILPIIVVQGGITLLAVQLDGVLTEPMIAGIGALGGFLVLGIGLRLLELRPIRVANLLPGLVIVPVVIAVLTS